MKYEVVNVQFRTELDARWSVFFDYLQVPWAYQSVTFRDAAGRPCTPPFWLPRERIWFHPGPDEDVPDWWGYFACAACGNTSELEMLQAGAEEAGEPGLDPSLMVEVGEEWRGETVMDPTGAIPDGYGSSDKFNGPWRNHHPQGMSTDWDESYQWTICPKCDYFGAEYWGYAERLACACMNGPEYRKEANGGDERLMAAYRAAAEARFLDPGDQPGPGRRPRPVVRQALVYQEGAALAEQRCVGHCYSMAEQLRAELPEAIAPYAVDKEADPLCGACPGFVCSQCSQEPAAAAGGACRSCEPLTLLTYDRGRELLNDNLTDLARLKKEPMRAVNPAANHGMGVRRRYEASLAQIGIGLNLADQWLADPDSLQLSHPVLTEDVIQGLDAQQLRSEIAMRIGPLCRALRGEQPAYVQMRINKSMGVKSRAEATEEQLRTGLRQVLAWMKEPDLFFNPLPAQRATDPSQQEEGVQPGTCPPGAVGE